MNGKNFHNINLLTSNLACFISMCMCCCCMCNQHRRML